MSLRFGLLAALWFCLPAAALAADPPAVLHLTDGGHLPGALVGSDAPEVWRWRSPAFARPVEFPAAAVRGVHYAMPAAPPKPTGEFCFELAGEDVVYGDLAALTDTEVELTGTAVGRLRLKREHVRRLYRWKGNDTVYAGPNGLTGWTATPAGWREEGGHLVTDRPGAALFADLGLPDRAVVEVGLSWKGPPDFTLALGVDDRDGIARPGFRFEVWDGQLVVVGESPRDADVAVVQPAAANGSVRVQVVLDQTQRRLTLLSRAGKPLATLAIDPIRAEPRRGVKLVNGKGDLRVEHLRVARWAGPPPRDIRDYQPRVGRTDGSVVYGRVTGYDPEAKRFTVREGDRETAVPADAVGDVYLVAPTAPPPADAGGDARSLRVVLRDGTRVSGRPATVADTHLTLVCPGIQEPLRLPLADVRSLIPLRTAVAAGPPPEGRPGRLEADGVRLPGRLVGDGTRLLWHPDLGRSPGELVPGFAGRIVYRDPPPPPPSVPQAQVLQNRRAAIGLVDGQGVRWPQPQTASTPAASGRRSLYLRTGDAVPCEVVRIDEKGVTLKSPQTAVTFVPHEKVKSVELVATGAAPALDEAKRDRLLMLPRSQKDTPPTHLICAKSGDFLRGRLVAMDDAKLTVEVRLETKEIPRDRVAQIIWLHPDELAAAPAPKPDAGPKKTRAQTVEAGGNRLTFAVTGSDGRSINGTSDVLGDCRVALADAETILFGDAIERAVEELAYHRWKLRHAPEPKFVTAGADGGSAGADSPLVGQVAPPLRLPLLDGKPYDLAERKGKVVVLEFWATWCGPCLQTMPLVEAVTREFADKGVELLAVNLEEPQDKVKATLDRQKLAVPVALDRDGVAAGRYAVTSIPQVVVIDRDGKVARLFVGGGKETADGLRSALQALLDK